MHYERKRLSPDYNTQLLRRLHAEHGITVPLRVTKLSHDQRRSLAQEIRQRSWMGIDWWAEVLGVSSPSVYNLLESQSIR